MAAASLGVLCSKPTSPNPSPNKPVPVIPIRLEGSSPLGVGITLWQVLALLHLPVNNIFVKKLISCF